MIYRDIERERQRQQAIWGDQRHSDYEWFTILGEEIGEAARAVMAPNHNANPKVTRLHEENLRVELVQSAAVIVAWLEDLDRR